LPSRRNSFLLGVGIGIHGKEKKDLLAKLAYNPHMQLRRTKDCMYLCHRAESGVLNAHCTFLAFSFLCDHSRFQVHWKWSGAFCLLLCPIDDLSQSRHTQNLSHSFALNSIWPYTQDIKENRSWGMNTLINIQKEFSRDWSPSD
jgi:hypothetical protein